MTVPRSEWPVVVRDFYRTYLGDALHHLRFTQSARSLPFEHAANRAGKPRWADKGESDAASLWEGTRDLWEQVDPELRWSYRQPRGCRP